MIIRRMLPEELEIVGLLMQYYRDEAGIHDSEYDEDRAIQSIKNYSVNWNLFLRVAYEGSRPIGLIGGFLTESPVTKEVATGIQFMYLLEQYNSAANYKQLLDHFEEWSTKVKATSIKFLGIGTAPQSLVNALNRLGFERTPQAIMAKEIE